jgi:hypothetical protein
MSHILMESKPFLAKQDNLEITGNWFQIIQIIQRRQSA